MALAILQNKHTHVCGTPTTWCCMGVRKVFDLRHGNSMCQTNKVCVDALECMLCIHTRDIISSSSSSMTRETVRPPWSNICTHMIDCHYVSSHQNMYFESIYQKTQKKNYKLKKLKKRVWDSLPVSPYAAPGGRGMSRSPQKSIPA